MTDTFPTKTISTPAINNTMMGYRLLVIEDNIGDARLLQLLLEEAEFETRELVHKVTLKEGIETFDDGFDVVFLDLSLPDSRGFITLENFLKRHPKANVIVMTGLSDRETGIRAVKSGAQDFLVKGEYEVDKLLRTLYYSIERSHILKRFEEAQKLAKIGSWEFRVKDKDLFFSDDIFKILEAPPLGKRISYTGSPEMKAHPFYHFFTDIHKEVYHLYKQGQHQGIRREIEITPNGNSKFLRVKCYITHFEGENPVFYGIIQDITEQKKAEQISKEKELAEESAKLKEEFITNVSHEMRTPMNAILGMSNILLNTPLNKEQSDCLGSIKQSSEMLLGIVNDILEISSLQNGKATFENVEFDLHDLMLNLVEVMQYKITEKELSFDLTIDTTAIPKIVKGDKLRLNQILFNLVGNAVKFTDRGFIKIRVNKLVQEGSKAKLQFDIEDTGIGIPSDKLDAIFDTFTRVITKNRLFEGTGLGLSIARNLVVQQGGRIWVESKLGEGSIFHFALTFDIAKNQEEVIKVSKYSDLNVDPDKHFRLLLAEDNKLNQLVAKKTLEKQWKNINLTIVENGQKAIDILRTETFDVILMDIQMPVMDGYEATEYIRNNMPDRAHIPILAMTAFAHISKEDKFKEFGLDDFVLKPFEPEDLYYKVAIYSKNS
jgi:signal transduction histidine kinase/DNA-binding response OmpR family regulator